jgi:S1-C subfamily serine protease
MNRFGDWKKFKSALHDVHTDLAEQGKISSSRLQGKAKVVYLWKKYKRVTAIAASIAGITTISLLALVSSLSPKTTNNAELENLKREVKVQGNTTKKLQSDLINVKNKMNTPASAINYINIGTGFLISEKGLMITNAHVVKNSSNIKVLNNKGDQFNAFIVRLDIPRDVAVIKIDDDHFKSSALPYGISKTTSDIAEPIFTLGFPRDEIVYGEGYLSAPTGFNGDSLSCQITVAANPGNSGGPIFNHNGEVIGILSAKETQTEGAVFAVQSKYIYRVMDELKKNPLYKNVKLSTKTSLAGLNKVQQVKKIRDYVFMVKGD